MKIGDVALVKHHPKRASGPTLLLRFPQGIAKGMIQDGYNRAAIELFGGVLIVTPYKKKEGDELPR